MGRFCSIFNQVLQLFSRADFERAVVATQAERHARGFRSWDQFVAMLFCHLGRAHSLREITGGLASCEGRLAHLGAQAPARATLAYANAHRPWALFQQVFSQMLTRCRTVAPGKPFRFKHKLLSLDATLIELCAEVFTWAKYQRTKGAIKLHFTLDHDGYLPTVMVLTEGNRHEGPVAHTQTFPADTILVFDRGYEDFAWWAHLTATGVWFVTRVKANTGYVVDEQRAVPQHRGILADEIVHVASPYLQARYAGPLRRVSKVTPEGESLVFLTNHLTLGASTIARIYQDRWQIEIFFKTLKQHLRVKTFVGTSATALHTQLWTALIALLVLKYLAWKAAFGWSLSNLAALLRMNLFVYRNLWAWLDTPFTAPPIPVGPQQAVLGFD